MSLALLRLEARVVQAESLLIFIALAGLIVMQALQVLFRFVLSSPLGFSEEMSRLLFAWLIFLGAARAVYVSQNFVVDVAYKMLPGSVQKATDLLTLLVSLIFLGLLSYTALRTFTTGSGQILPILGIPKSTQTVALPVSTCLMLLHILCGPLRKRHGISTEHSELME